MIVVGIDPALGGGCAFVTAALGDKLVVLDAETHYDFNKTEEIFAVIERLAARYRPNIVIIEYDAQQKGIGNDDRLDDMARRHNFRVQPHITRGTKTDETFGVASMDQSFRAGDIRIPYGSPAAEHAMTPFLHQLRSWRPDVPTKNLTQDLVMALWFVWRHWMETKARHIEPAKPAWRPSFLFRERRSA